MSNDNYNRFVQLKNAIAPINQTVNLVGAVSETGLPRTTKGTDVFCPVKIMDRTRISLGLYVHFFAETMDKLPMVHTLGDIIVINQVKIKMHGSGVNAVYNKQHSSFAIFKRREDGNDEVVPYQCSSNYVAREQDKESVVDLRNWMGNREVGGFTDLLSLSEIKVQRSGNLLCEILHVCQVEEGVWMLFVWDGTDIPSLPVEANLEDEMDNPLPLQLEPSLLSRDMLCSFPVVGSVLRMIIGQKEIEIGAKFIQTKRWVTLVNINFESRDALRHAVFLPQSKLCYLPDDADLVLERKRSFEKRKKSRWGHMPLTSLPWPSDIAETDYPWVLPATLMNVLTYPGVTCRYKCVVRVVAILPWNAEDFRDATGIYRVRLTLEDPTARIHAYIYGEKGVKFFGNDHSVDILTRKRDMLLGISGGDGGQTSRNPPWIECCLRSYYTDEADIWGSRKYRIYATSLS